jgi:hypothetical protein
MLIRSVVKKINKYAEGQEDEKERPEWPFSWVCVEEEEVFPMIDRAYGASPPE